MTLIALGFFAPGLIMLTTAVINVPVGMAAILFAPWVLSSGMWALILGGMQFGFGLLIWMGHPLMRYLRITGPGLVLGLSLLSGLTNNAWSLLTIILCAFAIVYFQSQEAKVYFKLN